MKMRIERVRVETFKSGPRAGEWRTFELPEGATVLDTHEIWIGDDKMMTITYAVPA